MQKEKLRIDKYLWAIRIFKTRSMAAEACDNGKVKCNGESVKASKTVHVDDEFDIKTPSRKWKIRVKELLHNRMQHKDAVNYYTDITPPEELDRISFEAAVFHTGKRLSKLGRPTKKNKRDLDDFFSGSESTDH